MTHILFKQTGSHIPHEGNSEQLFSRAADVSDDSGKMDPARLVVWTSIGVNYAIFAPAWQQILERYLLKFSRGGTLHEDDVGLLNPDGGIDAMQDGGYYARWGEAAPQAHGEHAGTHLG